MTNLLILIVALAIVVILKLIVRGVYSWVGKKALAQQVDEIHLLRREHYSWRDPAAMSALVDPLLARGFIDVGIYALQEMPAVMIHLLVKPDELVGVSVYEHEKVGTWVDLFSRFQDNTGITYATTRNRGLDPRPGFPVVHLPDLGADELYQRFVKERPARPLVILTAEQLPHFFEMAYAESMAWRKHKGISSSEVAKVAKSREG